MAAIGRAVMAVPETSDWAPGLVTDHRVGDGPGEGGRAVVAGVVGGRDGDRVGPGRGRGAGDGAGGGRWSSPAGRPVADVGEGGRRRGVGGRDRQGGDGRARDVGLGPGLVTRHRVGDGPGEGGRAVEAGVVGGRDGHRVAAGRGRGAGDGAGRGVDGQPGRQAGGRLGRAWPSTRCRWPRSAGRDGRARDVGLGARVGHGHRVGDGPGEGGRAGKPALSVAVTVTE